MTKVFLFLFCLASFAIVGCGVKGDPQPYIESSERPENPSNQKGES